MDGWMPAELALASRQIAGWMADLYEHIEASSTWPEPCRNARVAYLEKDGIAPGTKWEDVPETWTCPDCGVTKEDFELLED